MSLTESLVVSVPEAATLLGVSEGLSYQLLDKRVFVARQEHGTSVR